MRAVGPVGYRQRILAGLVGIGLLDPAVFEQAIDHVIAALDRPIAVTHRMQQCRRLRQRRQIGRFRDREFVHRLVEIDQRRGGNTVGAEAEIDLIEIEFEDAVLRVGALDSHRQQGFLDLAGERHLVGQEEVLGDLLGDRGRALRPAVGTVILRVQHRRARHALIIDAAMLVEILVFGRQERVDDEFWNRLDRQIEPALLGVLAEQRTVRRVDARHHRRLIILKLRIVGQVLGKVPDRARDAGDAYQEQHGSGSEQETHEPHEQAHYRSSVPTLAPLSPASVLARKPPPNEPPQHGPIIHEPTDNIGRFRRPSGDFLYRCRCGQTRASGIGPLSFRSGFHLAGPAVASRLAKNASIACAIEPTVLVRQFSDTRCSRSPLFET